MGARRPASPSARQTWPASWLSACQTGVRSIRSFQLVVSNLPVKPRRISPCSNCRFAFSVSAAFKQFYSPLHQLYSTNPMVEGVAVLIMLCCMMAGSIMADTSQHLSGQGHLGLHPDSQGCISHGSCEWNRIEADSTLPSLKPAVHIMLRLPLRCAQSGGDVTGLQKIPSRQAWHHCWFRPSRPEQAGSGSSQWQFALFRTFRPGWPSSPWPPCLSLCLVLAGGHVQPSRQAWLLS